MVLWVRHVVHSSMLPNSWDWASFCKLGIGWRHALLIRFIYGWVIHPGDDSVSAFLKVYGFDIQVVSASWGTERAEVSIVTDVVLKAWPKTHRLQPGQWLQGSDNLDVCKRGTGRERRSVHGMNFPMIFPFQKHSSGCFIHPILRGLQSWPKMRCGWRSGNQSHWHQFQAKHKDSGTSITKFMQEQAIGTKPDRDKERQFLCNAVLGSQDASNAKRSTCHRLILSRTDMNDWTDSWVRSVELNGSFFGSRHFPVLRNHATGGDRSSGVLLPKHLPGAWLDQSHGVERRLRYSTWKRAGMIHWHQRLRLWGILSASLMAFLSFLHGLTSIWKVRALPSTPSRSYLREIAVPS